MHFCAVKTIRRFYTPFTKRRNESPLSLTGLSGRSEENELVFPWGFCHWFMPRQKGH
jgi:hypothetical protein